MQVRDLTDEDIGRCFWLHVQTIGEWRRVVFEGFTKKPAADAHWVLVRVPPSVPGAIELRSMDSGELFRAVICKASEDVWPVQVDWAVTDGGEIVEIGERSA